MAAILVVSELSATSSAEARGWHRGGGWVGPAIVGGLALGALAAAARYAMGMASMAARRR
jgi:hypothetical protein